MITDPSPLAIAAGSFLAGIAFAILAFLVPDFVQGIRDLRRPRPLFPEDRAARAVERALAMPIYIALSILGVTSIAVAVLVFRL
jgi:hypothetical protein